MMTHAADVIEDLVSDISVDHVYKWALKLVERCVHCAAPGQPKGGKEASMTPQKS
jgi:hypothetical protein